MTVEEPSTSPGVGGKPGVGGEQATARPPGRPRQRRYGFLVGVCVGLVLAFLAGQLRALAVVDDRESGELVLVADRDQSFGRQRHELIGEWNATHEDNRVTLVEVPTSATAARSQIVASAQSAAGSADVYSLDITWTAEFADAHLIRPLDESDLDTDGFLDGPLAACRHSGRLWALPFNTDAGLLYYRKDLVAAPDSWDAMAAEITRVFALPPEDRPESLEAGYAGQLADYEGLTVNAVEAIWDAGGDVVDADGHVVPTDQMMPGLERLVAGLASTDPPIILRDSLAFDEFQSTQAFRQGRVLFMRNWPVAYRHLTASDGGDTPPMDPELIGVMKLPGQSVLGGQNLAIAAGTDRPRAAQELIEFLTGARSQQKLFEHGGFAPTQEVVYHDDGVGGGPDGSHPYLWHLLQAVQQAKQRPVSRHYEQFSAVFRSTVHGWLDGGEPLGPDTTHILEDALKGYRRD